jgi:decaprenylphospho-beta-D-ribofuranose 2-oxidase
MMRPPSERELSNYSGTRHILSKVLTPNSERDLLSIFERATHEGKKVVFRGGGVSFDTQSMAADIVVSMENFRDFSVDLVQSRVTVGTGMSWGEILDRLQPHGLLPGVIVSSSHATPGGTLSNNSHQRFSPTQGKEGDWIESLRMVTPKGEVVTCNRDDNRDLFLAVVGGLGWIGAVVSITYRLMHVDVLDWVETHTQIIDGADEILPHLLPSGIGRDWPGSYAPIVFKGNRARALVCRSRHPKPGTPRIKKRMILHKPWSWDRIPFDLLYGSSRWSMKAMWFLAFGMYYRLFQRFGDPLKDYTFFMDGHAETRRFALRWGVKMFAFQQAFVLPVSQFESFLTSARDIWTELDSEPTMVDVIHLPKDRDPFLLSPNHAMDGIAFTISYESLSDKNTPRISRILRRLSALCARMGGKVHLTKNVVCDPQDLEMMYGPQLDAFFRIKRKTDPRFILRNEFMERLFPKRVQLGSSSIETHATI